MKPVPEVSEITIIVNCGGKTYVQGPYRNILTGVSPTFVDVASILRSSVAHLLRRILLDISHELNRGKK